MSAKPEEHRGSPLTAVVADGDGNIFELPGYGALGMAGDAMAPLSSRDTLPLPYGSELMFLPDRMPVVLDVNSGRLEVLARNPHDPDQPIFPVAAFNSPGYVNLHVAAYRENPKAACLPLFSYGAVGWHRGRFRSAAMRVDREKRQDLRHMPQEKITAGIRLLRERLPDNRLCRHLETCALEYGCPAGKNFFLGRFEAPLPTARICNARCLGCLSLQADGHIPSSQRRIAFTPSAEEIAQVALLHIRRVRHPVVSFGQGCEGEPLQAADVIEPAIRIIRAATRRGTINLNSNASRPETVARFFDAGLDSLRVSINSLRPDCYRSYFRPRDYDFEDVMRSIAVARRRTKFVSINYLNMPGFTDSPQEMAALERFLDRYGVDMIQWRNLNYDPARYWAVMNGAASHGPPMGIDRLLHRIRRRYPDVKHGYFNPPKEKFKPR